MTGSGVFGVKDSELAVFVLFQEFDSTKLSFAFVGMDHLNFT